MIIVISCASGKQENAGHLRMRDERRIEFVANPDADDAPTNGNLVYARPTDLSDTGKKSWLTVLKEYNEEYNASGDNPRELLPAWKLYKPAWNKYKNSTYESLFNIYKRVYILSAGWGLIRANFLIPKYDITFSSIVVSKAESYKYRDKDEEYDCFNHLPSDVTEPLVFFGGQDYIPSFCRLTKGAKGKRTVFWVGKKKPDAPGCILRKYERYDPRFRRTWYYRCAMDFAEGCLPSCDRIPESLGFDL